MLSASDCLLVTDSECSNPDVSMELPMVVFVMVNLHVCASPGQNLVTLTSADSRTHYIICVSCPFVKLDLQQSPSGGHLHESQMPSKRFAVTAPITLVEWT